MKIKDLSFIAEIDQENANHVNGGMVDPFAWVGYDPGLEFREYTSQVVGRMIENQWQYLTDIGSVESTFFEW